MVTIARPAAKYVLATPSPSACSSGAVHVGGRHRRGPPTSPRRIATAAAEVEHGHVGHGSADGRVDVVAGAAVVDALVVKEALEDVVVAGAAVVDDSGYLVLDTLEAVEEDGPVAALDVLEGLVAEVECGAAQQPELDQRARARQRARHPRTLEIHLARRRRRPGFS